MQATLFDTRQSADKHTLFLERHRGNLVLIGSSRVADEGE